MKVYKFGDIPVGVETRGVYFNDNCINYLAEKAKPEFVIKATDKDLEFEQMQSESDQHICVWYALGWKASFIN